MLHRQTELLKVPHKDQPSHGQHETQFPDLFAGHGASSKICVMASSTKLSTQASHAHMACGMHVIDEPVRLAEITLADRAA